MENKEDSERNEVSVIKIFKFVQKYISTINTPPLVESSIGLNEDAYAELGGEYDEDEDFIFARIGVDFTKSYTELPFSMMFAVQGVGVAFGGQEFIFVRYEDLGAREQVIARKLVNILVGFSNGQIAILNTVTEDDEKVQAWEILYRKPSVHAYDAIATYAAFDSARKLKGRELTTQKFANTSPIDDVSVDVAFLRNFIFETGWLSKFNRKKISGLHVPLTRADWEKSVDKYYDDKAEGFVKAVDQWAEKDNRSLWEQVLDATKWRHLELLWWSLAYLVYRPVADMSFDHFQPAIIIFGIFVVAATVYRRDRRFYKYYPFIRPLAYVSFALATIVFVTSRDDQIWWVIIGVLGVLSLAENIFFDFRAMYIDRFKRKRV